MVKRAFLAAVLLFSLVARAQFSYPGVLKASATLCTGYMLRQTQTNLYVHGHLEYFTDERISLRGDGFWFAGAQQKPALLAQNSTFLFGGLYHMHKNRLDFFLGMQVGVDLTKPRDTYYDIITLGGSGYTIAQGTTSYKLKALPALSPVTGVTFYAASFVNFFLEVRYVSGRYFGYHGGSTLFLDELRLSAGLGFQLPTRKS